MEYLPDVLTALASLGAGVGAKWGYDRYTRPPHVLAAASVPITSTPTRPVCITKEYRYPDGQRLTLHTSCGQGLPISNTPPDGWVVVVGGGHEI